MHEDMPKKKLSRTKCGKIKYLYYILPSTILEYYYLNLTFLKGNWFTF